MRITIVLVILLSSFVFLAPCGTAYAKDSDIGQSRIHPAHPLYFLKSIRENLELKFAPLQRTKMIRQLEFSTRRIREVKALISKGNQDLIEPTMERYWSHMNTVLNFRPRDEDLTLNLNQTISTHLNVLENIYVKLDRKRAKMSIRTQIYRLLDKSDITGEARVSGCEFLSKETSASALNEAERAILLERIKGCLKL